MKIDFEISVVILGLAFIFGGLGYILGAGEFGGDFIKTLIYSLFASLFFYIPSVIFKEYREKKSKSKVVSPMIYNLIEHISSSIQNNVFSPNPDLLPMPFSFLEIPKLEFEQLLKKSKMNIPFTGWKIIYKYIFKPQTYLDALIIDTTLETKKLIQNLKPYYYLLKPELIELLCKLESCSHLEFIGGKLEAEGKFYYDEGMFLEFISILRLINQFKSNPC